jgi:hypothetical protein
MAQCPEHEAYQCASVMQQYMNQELTSPYDGVKFSMASEAVYGYNWAPHDDKKNPQGLREFE